MPPAIIASPRLATPLRAYCTALTSRFPRPFPCRVYGCPRRKNCSLNVCLSEYSYFTDFQCFGLGRKLRCKRYWCNGCQRTFNDLTHTLLHQSRRSCAYWILATFLLCLSCSLRRIAREVGVHGRTRYRWCWWLRNTAVSYETERRLEGTVEADDLYHTAGQKGQAQGGGTKP